MAARLPFLISAVFHYAGPAFAVLLFARVDALGVAWLRVAFAALLLAAWRRPWRVLAAAGAEDRRPLVTWGAVLAAMNCCFYLAIDRLPLATVAVIEFAPVVALAALGVRSRRNALALALAVPGVPLLTGVHVSTEAVGLLFALANALLLAAYIVLGHRVAARPALAGPGDVADQLAMARLPRASYALRPATAMLVGLVVLGQVPSPADLAGVALVAVGVAVHRP